MPYYFFGLLSAVVLFSALVWGPSLPFALSLLSGSTVSDGARAILTILELAIFDSSPLLVVFYAALAALTGANLALLLLYWRTRRLVSGGPAAGGALGALVAALGFGCASCGTLFLSFLLGSVSGLSLATVPFIDEFSYALRILGLALLAFSLARLIKHVNDPLVCPIQ
jgi:hypothetical protein